jgi:hypothetical protein
MAFSHRFDIYLAFGQINENATAVPGAHVRYPPRSAATLGSLALGEPPCGEGMVASAGPPERKSIRLGQACSRDAGRPPVRGIWPRCGYHFTWR